MASLHPRSEFLYWQLPVLVGSAKHKGQKWSSTIGDTLQPHVLFCKKVWGACIHTLFSFSFTRRDETAGHVTLLTHSLDRFLLTLFLAYIVSISLNIIKYIPEVYRTSTGKHSRSAWGI